MGVRDGQGCIRKAEAQVNLAARTLSLACQGGLSSEHALDLLASGGQLVDVRSPADFSRDALPGALNLPIESLSYDHRLLSRERPVIVYGASEFRSTRAARLLAGQGFQRIFHLGEI
ncbi:MAG: rhodanese-like domain-containing protein [Gammaproteobacteria bacterium]